MRGRHEAPSAVRSRTVRVIRMSRPSRPVLSVLAGVGVAAVLGAAAVPTVSSQSAAPAVACDGARRSPVDVDPGLRHERVGAVRAEREQRRKGIRGRHPPDHQRSPVLVRGGRPRPL